MKKVALLAVMKIITCIINCCVGLCSDTVHVLVLNFANENLLKRGYFMGKGGMYIIEVALDYLLDFYLIFVTEVNWEDYLLDFTYVGFYYNLIQVLLTKNNNLKDLIIKQNHLPPNELYLLVLIIQIYMLLQLEQLSLFEASIRRLKLFNVIEILLSIVNFSLACLSMQEMLLESDPKFQEVYFKL
jgi:hypothetical protein